MIIEKLDKWGGINNSGSYYDAALIESLFQPDETLKAFLN
jgi:hypothetical protein